MRHNMTPPAPTLLLLSRRAEENRKAGAAGRGPARQQRGGQPHTPHPRQSCGDGLAGGHPHRPDLPSLRGLWTQLTRAISALMWFFVFRDGCRPSPRQQNTSSPVRSTSSSHRRIPFRINHWARLIMVISHLRRTKISISCNPAHVILNPVLPHASSTFWLLS